MEKIQEEFKLKHGGGIPLLLRMKAIVSIMLVLVCAFGAMAQRTGQGTLLSDGNGVAVDTVTNTGTETATITLASAWDAVGVTVKVTRISGTAGGTITLLGSTDGTTYFAVPSASAYTVTNVASQGVHFNATPYYYKKLRVQYVGTGTMACSFSALVTYKATN